jgi:hypothetical protein
MNGLRGSHKNERVLRGSIEERFLRCVSQHVREDANVKKKALAHFGRNDRLERFLVVVARWVGLSLNPYL